MHINKEFKYFFQHRTEMDDENKLLEIKKKLFSKQEQVDLMVKSLQQKRVLHMKKEEELIVLKDVADNHFKKLKVILIYFSLVYS